MAFSHFHGCAVNNLGLTKKYGETVVFSNLNYTFENTCIYGLVGRNGAGKTTLLNILSNYDKNYTGVISIDGEKMNKVDYLDMPVAYLVIECGVV